MFSSDETGPKYYHYLFAVNFKDAAGNDLVAPFKDMTPKPHEKPTDYNLDILFYPLNDDAYNPMFLTGKIGDNWYLLNDCMLFRRFGQQESLTYRITWPALFGDNLEHDIVSYWGDNPILSSDTKNCSLMPECTKAVFDGKELDLQKMARFSTSRKGNYYIYYVDIVLDK